MTDSYWDIIVYDVFGNNPETREQAWDRYYQSYTDRLKDTHLSAQVRSAFERELRNCEKVLKGRFLK